MRNLTPLMASLGGAGYPINAVLKHDPENANNPETATETAGAYLYSWKHDATPSWWGIQNYPFQLDWESGEDQGYLSLSPYSTGIRVTCAIMPVNPGWAQEVILGYNMNQDGTFLDYDSYPIDGHCDIYATVECDGELLELDVINDGRMLLWTSNNDWYAAAYMDAWTLDSDATLETKLAAANPNLWGTNEYQVKIQYVPL